MIFEKLPEQVQAIQWGGTNWNGRKTIWIAKIEEPCGWLGYFFQHPIDDKSAAYLYNRSIKDETPVRENDWVIYEPDREIMYVYDDETFRRKFKRVGL